MELLHKELMEDKDNQHLGMVRVDILSRDSKDRHLIILNNHNKVHPVVTEIEIDRQKDSMGTCRRRLDYKR